mmetsp:Transcript_33106/g.53171  ORF Transcript_33106/g.53171 Transcript_33106/m.53171 type:complete len:148 (+) Transcript_33106:311-754(+)
MGRSQFGIESQRARSRDLRAKVLLRSPAFCSLFLEPFGVARQTKSRFGMPLCFIIKEASPCLRVASHAWSDQDQECGSGVAAQVAVISTKFTPTRTPLDWPLSIEVRATPLATGEASGGAKSRTQATIAPTIWEGTSGLCLFQRTRK